MARRSGTSAAWRSSSACASRRARGHTTATASAYTTSPSKRSLAQSSTNATAWLVSVNAEIESEPQEYAYQPGYYAVFFYDPDGLKLEIVHVPGLAA